MPNIVVLSILLNGLFVLAGSRQARPTAGPHPVVIVPGEGGSQIYIRPRDEPNTKPVLVWMNLSLLQDANGLTNELKLSFDSLTGKVLSNNKYDIITPGWGDTESIEYLDPTYPIQSRYLYGMIKEIKKDPYYESNLTIRGAPYDFRKAPNELPFLMEKLKTLVEETYSINGNRKVVMVAHSLGTLFGLYFLKQQTDAWKECYIKSIVFVSGPYGGTVTALKAMISGDNFGLSFVDPLTLRPVERTMSSLALMLPSPQLWRMDEPVIVTENARYSAHDYKKIFCKICEPQIFQMYLDTIRDFNTFARPTGVKEVICVHGSDIETEEVLYYPPTGSKNTTFADEIPQIKNGPGDGTVNLRSLQVCHQWENTEYEVYPGATHTGVTDDPRFLSLLRKVIGSRAT